MTKIAGLELDRRTGLIIAGAAVGALALRSLMGDRGGSPLRSSFDPFPTPRTSGPSASPLSQIHETATTAGGAVVAGPTRGTVTTPVASPFTPFVAAPKSAPTLERPAPAPAPAPRDVPPFFVAPPPAAPSLTQLGGKVVDANDVRVPGVSEGGLIGIGGGLFANDPAGFLATPAPARERAGGDYFGPNDVNRPAAAAALPPAATVRVFDDRAIRGVTVPFDTPPGTQVVPVGSVPLGYSGPALIAGRVATAAERAQAAQASYEARLARAGEL